ALDLFLEERIETRTMQLRAELGPLHQQRAEQVATIDDLAAQLAAGRGAVPEDEISILEALTASALRRLGEYDVAIQEREFVILSSTGHVRVVSTPSTATEIASRALLESAQFGLLSGIAAAVLAVCIGRFRNKLLLLDEVREVAGPGIPILATVPRFRRDLRVGSSALVVGRRNTRREARAFRYLRTAIEVATDGLIPVVIAFTSSNPNEGKTVTASNFALATARAERSIALLDGDLLNPSTCELFGRYGYSAFPAMLSGALDPATADWPIVQTNGVPLSLLVSQRTTKVSDRVELPTPAVEAMFGKLARLWDTVVVDCPPVLAVSDAVVLARAADVTVVIVRIGKTTTRDLDKALTQLQLNQVDIGGIVVTHLTDKSESYYGYGSGYGKVGADD
ncbi:MAG: CpsD/CapB family tyrosine-protein kinase, partial [Actinomycetota bacterium]|nr:CpsD/CapB family tyrosine-protein kinase [Actinomycetota bacterium]